MEKSKYELAFVRAIGRVGECVRVCVCFVQKKRDWGFRRSMSVHKPFNRRIFS